MPRAVIAITKAVVEAAEPKASEYFVWDSRTPGFGLRVYPNGRKTFVFQYDLGGRQGRTRRITLGASGPALPVASARKQAEALQGTLANARLQLAGAVDPAEARDRARAAGRAQVTVAEMGQRFLEDRAGKIKPRSLAEWSRLMRREIVPELGSRSVVELSTLEVARWHASKSTRPILANRALELLRTMLRFAESQGVGGPRLPTDRVKRYPARRTQHRQLTPEQYAALGGSLRRAETEGLPVARSLAKFSGERPAVKAKRTGPRRAPYARQAPLPSPEPANPFAVALVRFLALSGWRKGEALSLRWEEVDIPGKVARLSDTKTGASLRPLGAAALAVLESLPRLAGNPHVFPGRSDGSHLQEPKRLWLAAREAAGLAIPLHGLRHAFITVARELGYGDHVIARLVGHTLSGMTSRYGEVPDPTVREAADRVSGTIERRLQRGM